MNDLSINEKAKLLLMGWTEEEIEIYLSVSKGINTTDKESEMKEFISKLEEKYNGYKQLKNWGNKHI